MALPERRVATQEPERQETVSYLSSRTSTASVGIYSRANYKTDDVRSRRSLRSRGMTMLPRDPVVLAMIRRSSPHRPMLSIEEDRVDRPRASLHELQRIAHLP